ncbi:MAG: hypothetical protein IIV65_01520 [Alistipes sp.]|nr:hypothetical protein [Alistipes sp.]
MKHSFLKIILALALIVACVDKAQAQLMLGVNGIEFLDEKDSLTLQNEQRTVQASVIAWVYRHPTRFAIGRRSLTTIPMVELGWNSLSGVDYGLYAPEQAGFLDLNNWRSTQFSINFVSFGAFDRHRNIGITMGLGLRANNYRLDRSLSLTKQGGVLTPYAIADVSSRGVKMSKFNVAAVHLPVEVMFGHPNRFAFSVGGYVDMVMNSHTKIKYNDGKKDKEHNLPVNFLQAGVKARFTFRWFSVYAEYQPTQLFKSGRGPEAQQWTIGIGF